MTPFEIAVTLADRRKRLGLTQSALAAQLGVRGRTVSRWERTASRPSLLQLGRWTAALDCYVAVASFERRLVGG